MSKEEEWNKMFEEFILKARKLFRKMVAILSKFTVLYLSSFFFFIKINLVL